MYTVRTLCLYKNCRSDGFLNLGIFHPSFVPCVVHDSFIELGAYICTSFIESMVLNSGKFIVLVNEIGILESPCLSICCSKFSNRMGIQIRTPTPKWPTIVFQHLDLLLTLNSAWASFQLIICQDSDNYYRSLCYFQLIII